MLYGGVNQTVDSDLGPQTYCQAKHSFRRSLAQPSYTDQVSSPPHSCSDTYQHGPIFGFGDTVAVAAHSFLWATSRSCIVVKVFENDAEPGEIGRMDMPANGCERRGTAASGQEKL